jgi:hypothetical protein
MVEEITKPASSQFYSTSGTRPRMLAGLIASVEPIYQRFYRRAKDRSTIGIGCTPGCADSGGARIPRTNANQVGDWPAVAGDLREVLRHQLVDQASDS